MVLEHQEDDPTKQTFCIMYRTIFLPILILAFLTSCEKQETLQSDVSPRQYIAETNDRNEKTIEGITFKSGGWYSYDELQEKAPELFQKLGGDELRSNAHSRAIKSRWMLVDMFEDCTSPCTELGQEVQGQKTSSTWVQVASAPSYDPYALLVYKYDPKGIANYDAGSYHYYKHWNYNDEGNLDLMFMLDDPAEGGIWIPDIDNVDVACNGVVTWFKMYSEFGYIPPSKYVYDENAVVYLYSSSVSC